MVHITGDPNLIHVHNLLEDNTYIVYSPEPGQGIMIFPISQVYEITLNDEGGGHLVYEQDGEVIQEFTQIIRVDKPAYNTNN